MWAASTAGASLRHCSPELMPSAAHATPAQQGARSRCSVRAVVVAACRSALAALLNRQGPTAHVAAAPSPPAVEPPAQQEKISRPSGAARKKQWRQQRAALRPRVDDFGGDSPMPLHQPADCPFCRGTRGFGCFYCEGEGMQAGLSSQPLPALHSFGTTATRFSALLPWCVLPPRCLWWWWLTLVAAGCCLCCWCFPLGGGFDMYAEPRADLVMQWCRRTCAALRVNVPAAGTPLTDQWPMVSLSLCCLWWWVSTLVAACRSPRRCGFPLGGGHAMQCESSAGPATRWRRGARRALRRAATAAAARLRHQLLEVALSLRCPWWWWLTLVAACRRPRRCGLPLGGGLGTGSGLSRAAAGALRRGCGQRGLRSLTLPLSPCRLWWRWWLSLVAAGCCLGCW